MFRKNNNKEIFVMSPVSGAVFELSEVPDQVFSSRMLGDGIAVKLEEGMVVAPFDGFVKNIFPTGHALVVESAEGVPLLIHIGIETVNLKGEGFDVIAKENQRVKTGDPLVEVDIEKIERKGYSLISPLVIPDMNNVSGIEFIGERIVKKGRDLLMKILLK